MLFLWHCRHLDLASPKDDIDADVSTEKCFDPTTCSQNQDNDSINQLYGLDHYDSDDDNEGVYVMLISLYVLYLMSG